MLRRNRQFDLLQVLAIEPLLMGLGIDEGTALLVTEERADVIGQSYVAVYNSAEWWAASDSSTDSGDSGVPQRDPFYVLGHGQSLDLVTRLPVGGEGAGDIEDELMRAILSDPELVVIMRQSSAQQLLLHLQMVSSLHAKTVQSAAAHYSVRVLLLHVNVAGSTQGNRGVQEPTGCSCVHPAAIRRDRTITRRRISKIIAPSFVCVGRCFN